MRHSLLLIAILLGGCAAKSGSDLLGTWKDTAVDKIPRLTADKREKMRMHLTLRAGGEGEMSIGSTKTPFQWSEKDGTVAIKTPGSARQGQKVIPFTLSADRRKMTFAATMEMVKQ